MHPHHLNFAPGSQASGDDYVQIAQSASQDSHPHPSLQGFASYYLATAPLQSHPLFDHDVHGFSTAPQMPQTDSAPPFRPSVGSRFMKTPSLSSHPYHHARVRHHADRTFVQHQGQIPPPFIAFPSATSSSSTVTPYNAVIGNPASVHCHDAGQLRLEARNSHPAPTLGLALQPDIVPNTSQNFPSMIDNFTVPEQISPPTHRKLPPYTPVDPADIEYAQSRYGNTCCFYRCRFDLSGSPCNKWIVGERTQVLRHLRNYHHLQTGPAVPARCLWDECTHSRPMKQENLSRHVVTHLGVKWKCPHCGHLFSRDDAVHRHMERMAPGVNVAEAEVVPGHEACSVAELRSKRARTA